MNFKVGDRIRIVTKDHVFYNKEGIISSIYKDNTCLIELDANNMICTQLTNISHFDILGKYNDNVCDCTFQGLGHSLDCKYGK